MERRLTLKKIAEYEGKSAFIITRQTVRGSDFAINKDKFYTNNRSVIRSYSYPAFDYIGNRVYLNVLGSDHKRDNNWIIIPNEHVPAVLAAVEEYNLTNGGDYAKPVVKQFVPNIGDNYYFVNSTFEVYCYRWYNDGGDMMYYNVKNCFATYDEAKELAERLKKCCLEYASERKG